MANGFICLHREILSKPIWLNSTPEQCKILVTLLLMANYKQNKWEWQGKLFECQPGQFVTSAKSIEEACGVGVTRQNIRTALKRFEKLEFLTMQSTKTGLFITIVNWQKYQTNESEANQDANQQLTISQPTANHQLTTNEQSNNITNINNIVGQVVDYLNLKTNKAFKCSTASTIKAVNARIAQGYALQDFQKVIDNKCDDWLDDAKMNKYLCPDTLFRPGHFEKYLNQKPKSKGGGNSDKRFIKQVQGDAAEDNGFYIT